MVIEHEHTATSRWVGIVGVAVLLAGGTVAGGERVDAIVRPKVTTAPATVRVTVRLERTSHDRSLTVAIDSGTFYRSSSRSLEGDREPRVHEFEFIDLPPGSYDVTCLVQTDNGENPTERSTVFVNSP
ncbi:MAG TPA: hypothetical protein VH583_07835 [Vicinamibacterales bacterium]|jgi:hypothetical protein